MYKNKKICFFFFLKLPNVDISNGHNVPDCKWLCDALCTVYQLMSVSDFVAYNGITEDKIAAI